jgi:ATP-dependent DNA helicase RecQ
LTDITVYAQKFLSCVKRADEKFGANHIVDILLGSKNEKIIRWGHDKLSTYNIGAELTKKQWMHIARQLTSMGYLKEAEYHTLKLTPKAMEMLKKREPVFGVVQEAERVIIKGQRTEVEYNRELFEILRAKRKELADSERVPPYVVFSDKALVEMAAYYPQSESAMMKITGVGKVKFKQYGELFMGMIKSFCEKNNIIALTPNPSPNIGRGESEVGEKTKIIAEGFNNGLTIQELMEGYGITQGTILEHLTKYVMAGNKLRSADELYKATSATKTQIQIAFSAFDESDNLFLRPVFDTLNGALNYDELKILKLLYLIHKQEKT